MPTPPPSRAAAALALGALLLLAGCASESAPAAEAVADAPGPSRVEPARAAGGLRAAKPRAFGDVNRVNVVADPLLLQTPVGDSIRYYYEQAYPLMPQPEALYDVNYLTVEQLEALPARRELRTYVVVADLADPSSPTTRMAVADLGEEKVRAARDDLANGTSIVTDRWASDQLIVYLVAEGPDALADLVARSFPAANRRIAAADRPKLEANIYQAGRATVLPDSIRRLTGVTLDVPNDYRAARAEDNFVWLRRDLGAVVQNLLVTSVPYTGEGQVSADSAVAYRNRLGRRAVRSNTPGSYMVTNDEDLPVLADATEIGGRYALEARGVWEMTDDFMGGPFFTYLLPDPEAGRLYVIDAFTFAPSKGKRNYMQQLEVIARSARVGGRTAAEG